MHFRAVVHASVNRFRSICFFPSKLYIVVNNRSRLLQWNHFKKKKWKPCKKFPFCAIRYYSMIHPYTFTYLIRVYRIPNCDTVVEFRNVEFRLSHDVVFLFHPFIHSCFFVRVRAFFQIFVSPKVFHFRHTKEIIVVL